MIFFADQQAIRRSVGWLVGVVFGVQIRGAERNTPIEYNQVVAECAKIKKIHVECK